jgi:hypothetical protein
MLNLPSYVRREESYVTRRLGYAAAKTREAGGWTSRLQRAEKEVRLNQMEAIEIAAPRSHLKLHVAQACA